MITILLLLNAVINCIFSFLWTDNTLLNNLIKAGLFLLFIANTIGLLITLGYIKIGG